MFAWSSLARGFFSDHYDPKNPDGNPREPWCKTSAPKRTSKSPSAQEHSRVDHHVTVAQVALAYVLCHPLHGFAVVGCTTSEKFAENVAALSLKLDGSDAPLARYRSGLAMKILIFVTRAPDPRNR